jgi:hypothetical protein
VKLHATREAALAALDFIGRLGCGGGCRRQHELIALHEEEVDFAGDGPIPGIDDCENDRGTARRRHPAATPTTTPTASDGPGVMGRAALAIGSRRRERRRLGGQTLNVTRHKRRRHG